MHVLLSFFALGCAGRRHRSNEQPENRAKRKERKAYTWLLCLDLERLRYHGWKAVDRPQRNKHDKNDSKRRNEQGVEWVPGRTAEQKGGQEGGDGEPVRSEMGQQ